MIKAVTRAIILNKEKKVLLGKRAAGRGKGQWGLVGGKPEEGETKTETIIREVNEETGLTLVDPVLWKEEIDTITVPGEKWLVSYFYGAAKGEVNLQLEEVSDLNYFSLEEITEMDLTFCHKKILDEFFEQVLIGA